MPSKLRWGLLISIPGYHVVGYPEVILEKPLGLPPNREMEFYIDLVLEARLVSIAPYCMVFTELAELDT